MNKFKRPFVGVIGYAGDMLLNNQSLVPICEELGRKIALKGWTVFNGGRDGVMEIVSKTAFKAGGNVVGILPWDSKVEGTNEYLTVPVYTGLDFQMRSFVMIKSIDVAVSIGGAAGTMIEILGSYANRVPVILIEGTGGWTDRLAGLLENGDYIDERKLAPVFKFKSVDEVIAKIEEIFASKGGSL
ncbi:MAG: hypothetical protein PWQ20_1053 [Thermotogaceae bacterium]|nr:hypothetical protein [Thermotogaceae bacterium]